MGKWIVWAFIIFAATLSTISNGTFANARTEQVPDNSNNNLMLSFNAPDDWNSGKLSMIALNVDWKLNGLFATNFATKLFGSNDQPIAFFAVINAPSLANFAIPLAQKIGLISLALSQYVTINAETDMTLSDGSSAHEYSISVNVDQLQKLKAPIDRPLEATLITTQQHDHTYIVIFATEQGRRSEFQNAYASMLNSVSIGGVGFSSSPPPSTSQTPAVPSPSSEPDVNEIPGNDTMILENDTSIGNPENTLLDQSPSASMSVINNTLTGDASGIANATNATMSAINNTLQTP